jgi:translation initiation factor IF-2
MTEDRDFKQRVRARAEKTGESYQAARRQLEQKHEPRFVATVKTMFRVERGVAFGCVIDRGEVRLGTKVSVRLNDDVLHEGTVTSLRYGRTDIDSVTEGDYPAGFGMIVDPPYDGPTPDFVTG